MKVKTLVLLFIFLLPIGALADNSKTRLVVQEYFNTYKAREDFTHFMSFYSDNAKFQDIVYGVNLENKKDIAAFLDWHNGTFEKLDSEDILTLTNVVIENDSAVIEGYFHRFKYNGKVMGPWLFTMSLKFDEHYKINKHTDWINYTPREEFLGGANINDTIVSNKHNAQNHN